MGTISGLQLLRGAGYGLQEFLLLCALIPFCFIMQQVILALWYLTLQRKLERAWRLHIWEARMAQRRR
jgi:hypothetical protein